MLYEIDPSKDREQIPVLQAVNGDAQFVAVGASGTGVLTASLVKGRSYVIEVFSDEGENIATTATLNDPLSNAGKLNKFHSVSYTHLTLPTSDLV